MQHQAASECYLQPYTNLHRNHTREFDIWGRLNSGWWGRWHFEQVLGVMQHAVISGTVLSIRTSA